MMIKEKQLIFDKSQAREVVKSNPRYRLADISSNVNFIRYLKLRKKEGWFKKKETLANTIIPRTSNHGGWDLMAQPLEREMQRRRDENKDKNGAPVNVVRLSMLTDVEMVEHPAENLNDLVRLRWFDHGTLDVTTGKNQTIREMREFQKNLYNKLQSTNAEGEADVCCHCMAGRSRSFFETIAYMYYHPRQQNLFDFSDPAWGPLKDKAREQALYNLVEEKVKTKIIASGKLHPSKKEVKFLVKKEMKNIDGVLKIEANLRVQNLLERLKNNPSVADIGEWTRLQRPKAKPLEELDGDQGGILGLISLDKMTQNDCQLIKERDAIRLLRDAQNIGFSLVAPLDRAFRDEQDVQEQKEGFIKAYQAFQQRRANLLMAMVVPIKEKVDDNYKNVDNFKNTFAKLKPSEQVHFAILMKQLEDAGADLSPFAKGDAKKYAEQAITKGIKKLTAGDEVELLRAFGAFPGMINYDSTVDKILGKGLSSKDKKVSQYNGGIQLAELAHIAYQRGIQLPFIEDVVKGNNLSSEEKKHFSVHLEELKQALQEFKIGIYSKSKKLTAEQKQDLVRKFMGHPDKLQIVLRVCSKHELGQPLYNELKKMYPESNKTELKLGREIARLRESHIQSWQHPQDKITRSNNVTEKNIIEDKHLEIKTTPSPTKP